MAGPIQHPGLRNRYPYTISTQTHVPTPEKTTVNLRMTETLLEDVDETWTDFGYNSRSEFVRDVLRDATKHPNFDRADLKAMLAGEREIQEGRTHASEEIKEAYDVDGRAATRERK